MPIVDETIPINDVYSAVRTEDERSRHTSIERLSSNGGFGVERISVHTQYATQPPNWDVKVWSPAEINWFAYGSTPIEDTRLFVEALSWAVEEAERINLAIGITSPPNIESLKLTEQ